jgi:hypothetical protein
MRLNNLEIKEIERLLLLTEIVESFGKSIFSTLNRQRVVNFVTSRPNCPRDKFKIPIVLKKII